MKKQIDSAKGHRKSFGGFFMSIFLKKEGKAIDIFGKNMYHLINDIFRFAEAKIVSAEYIISFLGGKS